MPAACFGMLVGRRSIANAKQSQRKDMCRYHANELLQLATGMDTYGTGADKKRPHQYDTAL